MYTAAERIRAVGNECGISMEKALLRWTANLRAGYGIILGVSNAAQMERSIA